MNCDYFEPFRDSAISTFAAMLGCTLSPRKPHPRTSETPQHDVSGIIGLSGKAKGMVVLCLSREAALAASGAMLGEQPSDVNPDVVDAVGELTNIIAGVAKAKLEHLQLGVSLPTVILGKQHVLEFPQRVTPICIPYDCPWGYVAIEVGLTDEVPAPRRDAAKDLAHTGV
jgi:chemotaxis protein CheX